MCRHLAPSEGYTKTQRVTAPGALKAAQLAGGSSGMNDAAPDTATHRPLWPEP